VIIFSCILGCIQDVYHIVTLCVQERMLCMFSDSNKCRVYIHKSGLITDYYMFIHTLNGLYNNAIKEST